jgi:hypothetical protein
LRPWMQFSSLGGHTNFLMWRERGVAGNVSRDETSSKFSALANVGNAEASLRR